MSTNFILNLFQEEYFWAALSFWGLVITFGLGHYKLLQQEKIQSLDKRLETDLRLKDIFRQKMSRLNSFKEDADGIFLKKISEIHEDEIRDCIFQVIDVLHDAFYVYDKRNENLKSSLWDNSFYFVFNSRKRLAFVSAYEKFKREQHFSKKFTDYVDKLIKQNRNLEL